ncbi:hypothetical protein JCM19237_256 [Photobacterium aphoticum]|uniref:Uncharacterized protein n=1 Tax=Photobacterium aphoticum TaxID=754436 RepID=A0A090QYC8_9GAMM|nr:hypothetical protein JCM19237_256 [Photobacterium aphoticum]
MSCDFEVSLPWGVDAVSESVRNVDVEVTLLQQVIINDLKANEASKDVKISLLVSQNSDLSIAKYNLEQELASLNEQLDSLRQSAGESAADTDALNARINELEVMLQLANEAHADVVARNHDQERKLTAANFQKDTVQKLFDDQRSSLVSLKKQSGELTQENALLSSEIGDARKYIAQLETEIAGIPDRIANAVSTEKARWNESAIVSESVKRDLLAGHEAKITSLRQQLEVARAEMAELKRFHKSVAEEVGVTISELINSNLEQTLLREQAIESMNAAKALGKITADECSKLIKEIGTLALDLEKQTQDNTYLSEILSYNDLKDVWRHEDGTRVFACGGAPTKTFDYFELDVKPSDKHYTCWVLNPNGTGHMMVLAEDESHLMIPAESASVRYNPDHDEPILEAMRAFTVEHYEAALARA